MSLNICAACGCKTRIVRTRHYDAGTYRRRRCCSCQAERSTWEHEQSRIRLADLGICAMSGGDRIPTTVTITPGGQ